MPILPAFAHQRHTSEFILKNKTVFVTSDPGTGKTRSVLDAFQALKAQNKINRMLVLCPLSIMEASWEDDAKQFTPNLTLGCAFARNREKVFRARDDITVMNHDGVKWLLANPKFIKNYDMLCVDESTAFKNHTSGRSKALRKILDSGNFEYRVAMTGTPNSNTILDIWNQVRIVDDGARLGNRFFGFRSQVCTPVFNGFANTWQDKPDAQTTVASVITDINIRYELENCIDMPGQFINNKQVTLPAKVQKQYEVFARDSVLYTGQETINAVHAGAKVKKLLQLCTGAVYDEAGVPIGIHKERYELVLDLVEQRKHSLVAFNWTHEKNYLVEHAEKRGIKYAVIDGSTPVTKRKEVVDRMQAGQLQVVFAHPQSAGHGLTMTKATSVIWCSPTYNLEHYVQFNRRIYRAGQKKRCEVVHISAHNTAEPDVYDKLQTKAVKMDDLLQILERTRSAA